MPTSLNFANQIVGIPSGVQGQVGATPKAVRENPDHQRQNGLNRAAVGRQIVQYLDGAVLRQRNVSAPATPESYEAMIIEDRLRKFMPAGLHVQASSG